MKTAFPTRGSTAGTCVSGATPDSNPRISHDSALAGVKPCSWERIPQAYRRLEPADTDEAPASAAWRMEEREEALVLSRSGADRPILSLDRKN
jgi:hypothetical protein